MRIPDADADPGKATWKISTDEKKFVFLNI
jgi:hypothetical protein